MSCPKGHTELFRADGTPFCSSDEWYTPQWFIERVVKTFGERRWQDPATDMRAINSLPPELRPVRYNTELDIMAPRAFAPEWPFFLNPTYSRHAGTAGRMTNWVLDNMDPDQQGIILVNTSSSADWYQRLLAEASAVLFPNKRIAFDSIADTDDLVRVPGTSPRYDNTVFFLWPDFFDKQHIWHDLGVIR